MIYATSLDIGRRNNSHEASNVNLNGNNDRINHRIVYPYIPSARYRNFRPYAG